MKSSGRAVKAHSCVDISLMRWNTAVCQVHKERVMGSVRMTIAMAWLDSKLNGGGEAFPGVGCQGSPEQMCTEQIKS